MTHPSWAFIAAVGLLLTAGAGCYHPSPYSPTYGAPYQTAPGAYPIAPGGTYVVPPGTTVPGTLGPSNSFPSGPGPTLAPPINGGDAPPYTFEGGANSSGGTVPMYDDPSVNDFGTPDDGFRPPSSGGTGSPFYEGSSIPRSLDIAKAEPAPSATSKDYFAGLDEFGAEPQAKASASTTATPRISPASYEHVSVEDFGSDPTASSNDLSDATEGFGFDRAGYRWLRGVIDFDPRRGDWHIIYGLPPDAQDKYGGSFVLADNGRLKDFQPDDVVLIEGRIDPAAGQDALGKPLYRVNRAELIGRFE